MNWRKFKIAVEAKGVKDDDKIDFIDVSLIIDGVVEVEHGEDGIRVTGD